MDLKSSWLTKRYIAHRGFHSNNQICPENSLPAFQEAINRDFAIELDVRITNDGKIITFHDDNLRRMTGFDKATGTCSYKEIEHLTLYDSEHKIPLLESVLELVNEKVPIVIEIKSGEEVGFLESELYAIIKRYKGEFVIQSFNPYSMKWFKENAPGIIRGQLSGDFKNENLPFYKKFLLKNLLLNKESSPSFINYDINCMPNWRLEWERKKGLLILGWTAKTKEQYEIAKKYCDNVVFEGFDPRGDINEF
ncbi:MAG TPA: glycerophosphodiester phosphodiesterase family protein [Bacillota bacterium]|nr:glycerophosphodiester phosphodiesterase family protein [Bacillota bacterium]HOR85314.1 glycerophosphodiester phosphodiesterase family protein [Bacillota bacterium]HPL52543.1 glycerophosphodiester phosphodiesterase family protein [Bacillota bacterium]